MGFIQSLIAVFGVGGAAGGYVMHYILHKMIRDKYNNNPYTKFQMPKYLEDHINATGSINFQVIAGRGKGKSTMVRQILLLNNMTESRLPETGSSETTKSPTAYKFKSGIKTAPIVWGVYLPFFEKNIDAYLWDMPGLGGLQISADKKWDTYLEKYGTGHFDRTFLICNANEGINEMELYFLRHLIHNKRNVTVVVSMTDSLMMGEQCDLTSQQITRELFDQKLVTHRQNFTANMKNQISPKLPDGILPDIGQRFK